jgi:hypothetical protein
VPSGSDVASSGRWLCSRSGISSAWRVVSIVELLSMAGTDTHRGVNPRAEGQPGSMDGLIQQGRRSNEFDVIDTRGYRQTSVVRQGKA